LLGSHVNTEGKIYLNAQTWAVISGVAEGERAEAVMDAVEKHLEHKAGPLLLHPAYTIADEKIGYLTRYNPGMRENGGVYTHAAAWAVMAEAMLKRSEEAYRMFSKINPINRSMKPDEYFVEPYVTPANIEGPESPFYGRGGWTWYTGSAAWLFRVGLDWILGVRAGIEGLIVDPCIPSAWKGFKVRRQFRGATYIIEVKNLEQVCSGVKEIFIDGEKSTCSCHEGRAVLPVFPAGTTHTIVIILGETAQEK